MDKPVVKPNSPYFSSGPCAKRPGWDAANLNSAWLGRSHRAAGGKVKLKAVIDQHVEILGIPEGYRCAIVPASDTGAVEIAMWNLLGARGVDMLGWESFGMDWIKDAVDELKLDDCRTIKADYGQLPDLSQVDTDRDVVFTWNGTTSGVRVPHADWIKDDRKGLTICDATSAVFAYDLPWEKLDVVTWSWQKVLGSEGAHGMLVLSPRAVERLESFAPDRPLPKIFRLMNKGALIEGAFKGETLNTPSMLATEDCLDALAWVKSIGGLQSTIERSAGNFKAVADWVAQTDWIEFLAEDKDTASYTSICLKITDPWFNSKSDDDREAFVKAMVKLLELENAAYDIASYRAAPAGIRIWGGATVDPQDTAKLMPWLDWAFAAAKSQDVAKAA
ncbi:MAG: phosphoserine transaminase [Alphaproteobacteria bacterium]|nr:phosphoserine transaminase [Alphaproteobacteria bacterium]NCQ88539.1 phosphoserine transaminase [Alphaproteobacteria bacterium]NCT06082.1 phosphoserine transaminase [Alphaproteobacteria bacterium]